MLAQYAKDNKSGKELNQDQFEDVMKILSKDVAGRVTVTCGIMVGCPMLGAAWKFNGASTAWTSTR